MDILTWEGHLSPLAAHVSRLEGLGHFYCYSSQSQQRFWRLEFRDWPLVCISVLAVLLGAYVIRFLAVMHRSTSRWPGSHTRYWELRVSVVLRIYSHLYFLSADV